MGRTEYATASIGVEICIKHLLTALTKDNYEAIRKEILTAYAHIDDPGDDYNDIYLGIVQGENLETNEDIDIDGLNYEEYKTHMITMCQYKFDSNWGTSVSLYSQTLLVPHHRLARTERHGYNRDGTNATSSILDVSKLQTVKEEIDDKMKQLKLDDSIYDVVFIVSQYSY